MALEMVFYPPPLQMIPAPPLYICIFPKKPRLGL